MKRKILISEFYSWISDNKIEVLGERRVSTCATNIDLANKGFVALFDNGTIALQGNPPQEFVDKFAKFLSQEVLQPLQAKEVNYDNPKIDYLKISGPFDDFDEILECIPEFFPDESDTVTEIRAESTPTPRKKNGDTDKDDGW